MVKKAKSNCESTHVDHLFTFDLEMSRKASQQSHGRPTVADPKTSLRGVVVVLGFDTQVIALALLVDMLKPHKEVLGST